MSKSQGSDYITPEAKRLAGDGTQNIAKGSDFGARKYWGEAANPASVKKMVGSQTEFSRVKHDNS